MNSLPISVFVVVILDMEARIGLAKKWAGLRKNERSLFAGKKGKKRLYLPPLLHVASDLPRFPGEHCLSLSCANVDSLSLRVEFVKYWMSFTISCHMLSPSTCDC